MRYLPIILLAVLSSCSLAESSSGDSPLATVWETDHPVPTLFSGIREGSADGERVYAIRERTSRGRALVAYDRDTGSEAWRQSVDAPCMAVVAAGRLFCPADRLFAFEAATGQPLWTYGDGRPDSFQLVEATADPDRVYIGRNGAPENDGRIFAVDAQTGALVWERAFESTRPGEDWHGIKVQSLTLSPEGDLVVAFTAEYVRLQIFSAAVLAAVDPATGEERWRVVDGGPETNRDVGTLTIWRDLVLYSDPTGQEAVAVDRRTRAVVWRAPYTPGSFSTRRAPQIAGGVAYFTDTLGGVFAVDAQTGAPVWQIDRPGGFLNHEVCGDVVYGDNQFGVVFERTTGRYLGRLFEDDATIPGQSAVADGVLYLSTSAGVTAFDCSL